MHFARAPCHARHQGDSTNMSRPAASQDARRVVDCIIDNRLWRDEKRSLPIARPRFRTKIGWNGHVYSERVFEALGFPLDNLSQSDGKAEELALQPPPIDPSTAEGKASRTKLLRAWVELSAWLAIYEKGNKEAFKDYNPMVIHVKADSERDLYQTGIGAHVSQSAYFSRKISLCAWSTARSKQTRAGRETCFFPSFSRGWRLNTGLVSLVVERLLPR
ncbi:hypothetical protein LXA43DRAFT_1087598 [Ganoderma leucocontextum]|nr:hypothetical protein LXA43DRAFT_1087598 [Ganoderma leucocontextum]